MLEIKSDIAIIVAVAENQVVGNYGALPWRLPADLRFFKAQTEGKIVIMGRKTYQSIGRALPNRVNFVITREQDHAKFDEQCHLFHSFEASLVAADQLIADPQSPLKPEIMIMGGAQLYQAALPVVKRLYYTEVHAAPEGDAYFPTLNRAEWREVSRQRFAADEHNQFDFSFVTLER